MCLEILIRLAKDEDIPKIYEMDRGTVTSIARLDGKKDLSGIVKRHREQFERFFSIAAQGVYVAEKDGEILGYIWLVENAEMFTGIGYVFVMGIAVKPEWRKRGIGKHLMDSAEEYCRKKGMALLKLVVNSKNKEALRLYRQLGFEIEEFHMRKKTVKEPKIR